MIKKNYKQKIPRMASLFRGSARQAERLRKALTVPDLADMALIASQTYDAIFKNRRALPETFTTKRRGQPFTSDLLKSCTRG